MARRDKGAEKRIAHERIERLVALATEAVRIGRQDRANRYGELCWRLKLRYQLTRTAADGRVCRACHAFLLPGATSRVRLTGGRLTVTCLACGEARRKVLAQADAAPAPGRS